MALCKAEPGHGLKPGLGLGWTYWVVHWCVKAKNGLELHLEELILLRCYFFKQGLSGWSVIRNANNMAQCDKVRWDEGLRISKKPSCEGFFVG